MKKVAYYGGTFDPVHRGHILVANGVQRLFGLDAVKFLPAFHAPHKLDSRPTSAYHRFAMLALVTEEFASISISTLELEHGKKRYTIETLEELREKHPDERKIFIMGADSWMDILTWRDWEKVLLLSDHIVATRPGYDISFDHVSENVRERIVDVRGFDTAEAQKAFNVTRPEPHSIFITDVVEHNISATEIRFDASDGKIDRLDDVSAEVAKYIEKYELYT